MHHPPSRRTPVAGPILVLIGLLALAGCQEDEITHAIVPRAAEAEKTRLLGVIYPHGDQTWFFKLTGPESAFADEEKPFNDFLQSVRFTNKAEPPVTWTVPEGWKAEDAPKPDYAAFRVGPPEKPLKLTVAALPKKMGSEVLDNVNRWRGQLGLSPANEADLPTMTKSITLNGDPVTVVDLTGAGMARKAAKEEWTYDKPEGWTEVPHPETTGVKAEAAFQVADGGETAEVTVTAFPGSAGGLVANLNRWCGQIDAAPITPEQADKTPTLTVAGRESTYADLNGKKGRILGVILSRGDKTWFFKMAGPTDLLDRQKPKFEAFVKSVQFNAAPGGVP